MRKCSLIATANKRVKHERAQFPVNANNYVRDVVQRVLKKTETGKRLRV